MTEKIEELRKDIAELQLLEAQSSRRKIKDILSLEALKLNAEIVKLQEQITTTPIPSSATPANTSNKRYQVKLNNYAWDQTPKFVKFYVTLPKVHTIPQENVECKFTNRSLELIVTNLENKDYVFTINRLLGAINSEQSNWKIKTDMVIINAAKVKEDSWSHVTELEKKVSDSQSQKFKPEDSTDPNEGLMSMMKNMYEKGDDEMKKAIAKAWTESQNKNPTF